MLSKEKGEKGTGVFCWENWDPAGMARQGVDHTDKSLIFNAKGIVVGKERAAKLLGAFEVLIERNCSLQDRDAPADPSASCTCLWGGGEGRGCN